MAKEYARNAKSFLIQHTQGVLSTNSIKYKGFPFGSVVPYDVDSKGRVSIFISTLASHFKNLQVDPKACLTVKDAFGGSDPQAHSRLSLLLEFHQASEEERKEVAESYFQRFPSARQYEGFHDFFFSIGEIRHLRWIAGFGEMGWLSREDFDEISWDEVAYSAQHAISHMNDDHQDALMDFARVYGSDLKQEDVLRVSMCALDRFGFRLQVQCGDGVQNVTIPFDPPLQRSEEVRTAIVNLLKSCREKLQQS